jgi:hypothetical protein
MDVITVRDLFEIMEQGANIKVQISEHFLVDDGFEFKDTLLYEGIKPLMEDGKLYEDEDFDENILDMEVLVFFADYDEDISDIVSTICLFPPKRTVKG